MRNAGKRPHVPTRLVSRDVRDHNLGLVLAQLASGHGFSRSYLSRATGLTPGSVTQLVNELEEYGLVVPTDDRDLGVREPGRRKELLTLADNSYAIASIELKNDSARVVCETLSGIRMVDEEHDIDFRGRPPESFADFVVEQTAGLEQTVTSRGMLGLPLVGVVVPAPVFDDHGTLLAAIDYGWGTVDLGSDVMARLGQRGSSARVVVFNDASSSLWAEYTSICKSVPNNPPKNVLYIKSDVGIGGSAILQGSIFNGSHGTAIEPGHFQIDPNGALCACGRTGCLVTTADPAIVLDRAGLASVDKQRGRDEALRLLLERESDGDARAGRALADADADIMQVLRNIIVLLTPECVVLGGYLSERVRELSDLGDATLDLLGYEGHLRREAILPSHYVGEGAVAGALMRLRDFVLRNAGRLVAGAQWVWRDE